MDITGIDITLLMAGIGAVAKSLHSDHKTDAAKKNVEDIMTSVLMTGIRISKFLTRRLTVTMNC